MSEPLIYGALVAVMEEIGVVGKNQTSQVGDRYRYRGIDDVMAALQPALIKAGVLVVPEVLEHMLGEYTTAKGSVMQHAVLRVKYTFYAKDGSSVACTVMGEGADVGDKSVNKAMAGAMKYAITQSLSVPTMESKDSEADPAPTTEGRSAGSARPRPVPASPRDRAPTPRGAAKAMVAALPLDQVLDRIRAAESPMSLQIIVNEQARGRAEADTKTIIEAAGKRKADLVAQAQAQEPDDGIPF